MFLPNYYPKIFRIYRTWNSILNELTHINSVRVIDDPSDLAYPPYFDHDPEGIVVIVSHQNGIFMNQEIKTYTNLQIIIFRIIDDDYPLKIEYVCGGCMNSLLSSKSTLKGLGYTIINSDEIIPPELKEIGEYPSAEKPAPVAIPLMTRRIPLTIRQKRQTFRYQPYNDILN